MKRGTPLRAFCWLVPALTVLSGWGGCTPQQTASDAPQPKRDAITADRAFSEAESLRLQYLAEASGRAIEKYKTALDIWRHIGEHGEAARASQRLGWTYEQVGALEDSFQSLEEGLELARESNQPELEAELLADLGLAHTLLGDLVVAKARCIESEDLATRLATTRGLARALYCLAEVEYHRGNLKRSLEIHRQAEPLWISLNDLRGQAKTLHYMGTVYSDLSHLDQADEYLSNALQLWDDLGDRRGHALTLVALGRLHDRQGEYQLALNFYNQAMELVEPMGDTILRASLVGGIGTVYEQLAEYPNALAYWTDSLELYRKAKLPTAVIDALISLGEIRLAAREHALALERFQQALAASETLEDQRLSSYALTYIGLVHQRTGNPREALVFYERALKVQHSSQDRRLESYTLGDIGVAYLELGDYEQALDYFHQALRLSRAAGDRYGEAAGLYSLARAEQARGDPSEARRHLEDTLQAAESVRTGVESHTLRSSYFASIQHYYESYIDVLMDLHQMKPEHSLDALAFQASERARARSLLDSLGEARVDIRLGVEPDLLERETDLRRRLDIETSRQLRVTNGAELESTESLAKELRNLTAQYDQVQAEIRSKSPRYAALVHAEPLGLQAVQEVVLDNETLILEYSLGKKRSFLWAVENHRHTTFELPAKTEIEGLVHEVFQNLTARLPVPGESLDEYRTRVGDSDSWYWDSASRLSEILLGPVADRMGEKRIVVVSDGTMQYLPFAALPVPFRDGDPVPLIAEHAIVNLPSVSALAVLRSETLGREEAPLAVAVLADPVFELDDPRFGTGMALAKSDSQNRSAASNSDSPLPPTQQALRDLEFFGSAGGGIPRLVATRQEAKAILAAAPEGQALQAVDFAANRATAMSPELGRYRIVHFATHGVINNEHPGLSGILLSMVDKRGQPQDGFLRLHDIYNLELPVELVVLSACNTALGKPVEGEGLVGLVRGFMYAGARRVVASLWKVDDEATAELMGNFYREMLKGNRPPASALRHAQLEMWRQSEWQSPFYWAAFVLQGEWM